MGAIRKTMSMCTLGLIDFRSDRERTAKYARQTRNAVRAQAKRADAPAQPTPTQPPPGWFQAPSDPPGALRWWDGVQWTQHVQPAPAIQEDRA